MLYIILTKCTAKQSDLLTAKNISFQVGINGIAPGISRYLYKRLVKYVTVRKDIYL